MEEESWQGGRREEEERGEEVVMESRSEGKEHNGK